MKRVNLLNFLLGTVVLATTGVPALSAPAAPAPAAPAPAGTAPAGTAPAAPPETGPPAPDAAVTLSGKATGLNFQTNSFSITTEDGRDAAVMTEGATFHYKDQDANLYRLMGSPQVEATGTLAGGLLRATRVNILSGPSTRLQRSSYSDKALPPFGPTELAARSAPRTAAGMMGSRPIRRARPIRRPRTVRRGVIVSGMATGLNFRANTFWVSTPSGRGVAVSADTATFRYKGEVNANIYRLMGSPMVRVYGRMSGPLLRAIKINILSMPRAKLVQSSYSGQAVPGFGPYEVMR